MREVAIGGLYLRVADFDWDDPVDPTYAAVPPGERWNPPGLPCLYLNADVQTARANVHRKFEGLPYGPEDLDPATAPVLVEVAIPQGAAADARTDEGLMELGLPTTYPLDHAGVLVPHAACQRLGRAAFDAGLDGVAARSAADGGNEELAWFPRGRTVDAGESFVFEQWWWGAQ